MNNKSFPNRSLKFDRTLKTAIGLIILAGLSSAVFAQDSQLNFPLTAQTASTQQTTQNGNIQNIIVKGNQVESTLAILAVMSSKVGQPFDPAKLDADATTLNNLAIFKAKPLITAAHNTDGTFTLTVEVVENPVIKEIRITGNSAVKTADILKVITIKPGFIFSSINANTTGDAIQKLYEARGFFGEAKEINYLQDSPQTLNISIVELKIGAITPTGTIKTKPRILAHLIKSRVGDIYSLPKFENDVRRIQNTGWFSRVTPKTSLDAETAKIDLDIALQEARSGNLNFGVQVNPQSSFAGFVTFSEANINGTGQSIGANFTQGTSGGGPSVELSYSNPFIDNHDTTANFSLYSRVLYRFAGNLFGGSNLPTTASQYIERRTGGSIGFSRPTSDTSTVSLQGRYEGVKTSDLSTGLGDQFIQQDGTIGSATLGYTINRRDVDIDASKGDYLNLTVEPGISNITNVGGLFTGANYLGSNFFYKTSFDYRKYWTPDKPRTIDNLSAPKHVYAFRAQGGNIQGQVPFFEQFFVGGPDNLRGYTQDRYWGSNYLAFSGEYRYPLQKAFSLIGFTDYGGAWGGYGSVNDFYQTNKFRMHFGSGIGASFRTPLGNIRIDIGFNEKGGSRTDFQLGTSW